MAHCNRCGRNITASQRIFKRELYDGTSYKTNNYGESPNTEISTHYSMKTVCENCAETIDKQKASFNKRFITTILIIAIAIALYFLLK